MQTDPNVIGAVIQGAVVLLGAGAGSFFGLKGAINGMRRDISEARDDIKEIKDSVSETHSDVQIVMERLRVSE